MAGFNLLSPGGSVPQAHLMPFCCHVRVSFCSASSCCCCCSCSGRRPGGSGLPLQKADAPRRPRGRENAPLRSLVTHAAMAPPGQWRGEAARLAADPARLPRVPVAEKEARPLPRRAVQREQPPGRASVLPLLGSPRRCLGADSGTSLSADCRRASVLRSSHVNRMPSAGRRVSL